MGNVGSPFWPKYDRLMDLHLTDVKKYRPDRNPLGHKKFMAKGVEVRNLVIKNKNYEGIWYPLRRDQVIPRYVHNTNFPNWIIIFLLLLVMKDGILLATSVPFLS